MCLAIPGKLVEWTCVDEVFGEAWVDFGGVRRRVAMACVPDAQLGDYVLVHAGVAISKVKSDDAEERLAIWQDRVDSKVDAPGEGLAS